MAKAAAKHGIEDSDLVGRAVDQWAGARLKAQSNREIIAAKTIRHLEEDVDQVIGEHPPEEEWMDIYGGFAEKASKEKLQDTWSRVLAGEIRKPGTFSYATLQMISTLDAHIASEFEHYATQVSDEHTIIEPGRFSWTEDFPRIAFLKEFGVFSSDAARKSVLTDAGYIIRVFGQMCLVIRGEPNAEIQFNIMSLTRSGREIFSIIRPKVEIAHLRSTAVAIANMSEIKSVQICKILSRRDSDYDLAILDEITKSSSPARA